MVKTLASDAADDDAFARFERFLVTAMPGEEIVYHIGDLVCDAEQDAALAALRAFVWRSYCDGRVTLVQRRSASGVFAYVAIRRRAS